MIFRKKLDKLFIGYTINISATTKRNKHDHCRKIINFIDLSAGNLIFVDVKKSGLEMLDSVSFIL